MFQSSKVHAAMAGLNKNNYASGVFVFWVLLHTIQAKNGLTVLFHTILSLAYVTPTPNHNKNCVIGNQRSLKMITVHTLQQTTQCVHPFCCLNYVQGNGICNYCYCLKWIDFYFYNLYTAFPYISEDHHYFINII